MEPQLIAADLESYRMPSPRIVYARSHALRSHSTNYAPSRSMVNPDPKAPVTGLRATMTIDSATVIGTMIHALKQGGDAMEVT